MVSFGLHRFFYTTSRYSTDTVRKYAYAEQPPTKKLSAQERAKLKALRKPATVAN